MPSPQWGDVPTWGLLAGAAVTAVFAIKAFGKQSEEVTTLKDQLKDQKAVTQQQGELLKLQSEQVDLQRQQLADQQEVSRTQGEVLKLQAGQLDLQQQQLGEQRKINEKQAEVAELQAEELRESLDERKREALERRRAQAAQVFIEVERHQQEEDGVPTSIEETFPLIVRARVHNTSRQPIYDLHLSWHKGTAPLGNADALDVLMPGKESGWFRREVDLADKVDPKVFGAVVFFYDAAEVNWRARPDGKLDELPEGQGYPRSW